MYFSFLGYYTLALLPPATIGLVSKLLTESDLDLLIFFSFFNLIWATIFLESWKRNCATLAYQWGTINMEPFSKARAAYYGELGVNPVTGILEPQYPNWKRLVKLYTVSLPVVIVCLCLAVKVSYCRVVSCLILVWHLRINFPELSIGQYSISRSSN